MTEILVERYSEFPDLDAYLTGYAIVGDALARLEVPSRVLLSHDDPIIPVRDLHDLARSPTLEITMLPHGGHCGFMDHLNELAGQIARGRAGRSREGRKALSMGLACNAERSARCTSDGIPIGIRAACCSPRIFSSSPISAR